MVKEASLGGTLNKEVSVFAPPFIRLSDKKAYEYGKYAKFFFSLIRIK